VAGPNYPQAEEPFLILAGDARFSGMPPSRSMPTRSPHRRGARYPWSGPVAPAIITCLSAWPGHRYQRWPLLGGRSRAGRRSRRWWRRPRSRWSIATRCRPWRRRPGPAMWDSQKRHAYPRLGGEGPGRYETSAVVMARSRPSADAPAASGSGAATEECGAPVAVAKRLICVGFDEQSSLVQWTTPPDPMRGARGGKRTPAPCRAAPLGGVGVAVAA
jgi:hypothetical protein